MSLEISGDSGQTASSGEAETQLQDGWEGEMMFQIGDSPTSSGDKESCTVCEEKVNLVSCGCCSEPALVCGACCLLRHTEQRYMKHVPNEWSEPFEEVLRLKEPKSRTLPGAPATREGNHASGQDYGSGTVSYTH